MMEREAPKVPRGQAVLADSVGPAAGLEIPDVHIETLRASVAELVILADEYLTARVARQRVEPRP
jgi:hypothetical protein